MRSVLRCSMRSVLLAACACLLLAPPAGASLRFLPLPSFGPVSEPSNVAVNLSNHDIYVAAIGENAVDEFEEKSAGSYELASKISETPQGSFVMNAGEPAPVAVDPADGSLYVADPGHKVVDKFNSEGKYLCQLSGVGRGCKPDPEVELGSATTFGELTGVTVDSHGQVYVSDYTNKLIDEFTAAGADVEQISCGSGNPSGVAVDSNGVLYQQNYFSDVVSCPTASVLDAEESFDIATDSLTNDLYVDHGSSVAVYGPSPANPLLDKFSVGPAASTGIAVDGTARHVYVTDKEESKVLVFEPVKVPDVRLLPPPTGITPTEATLHGEIDPEETSEAAYYFEYGPTPTFNASTSSTSVPSVNAFVPATAALTGLQPATEYSYRLVGTNSSGLLERSETGTFETLSAQPEVSGVEAIDVTSDSVVFRGFINPLSSATSFRFEYGATATYGHALPEVPMATTDVPTEVQEGASGLEPGRTYHFRIVANGLGGEGASLDQTFATPPAPTHPETPPALETGSAVAVGPNGAILTGIVFTENTPTTFLFELGTSTAYGTKLYGGEPGPPEEAPTSVSVAAGNLQPGTEYHYRLIAVNAAGTIVGPDRTFTTSTFPQLIAQPSTPGLVPVPVFPTVKNPVYRPPKKKHHKAPPKRPKHRRAHGNRAARRGPRR
jgi:hypothetical protein